MDPFLRLEQATAEASRDQELPGFLADRITRIIANRTVFRGREAEIAALAGQVEDYDTYGQTGYLGMGVNNVILERSLERLERESGIRER